MRLALMASGTGSNVEILLSEKQAAIADIKNQVANLSIDIAEKVVREELSNKEKQAKLVEDMLGDVTLN